MTKLIKIDFARDWEQDVVLDGERLLRFGLGNFNCTGDIDLLFEDKDSDG